MQSLSRIKRLPLHEAQKIAAGQVVDRPVSVVKELIENALDAGATSIELRFKDAGCQQIRIIDNGCGMSYDDARICTQQYTTSKISSVDELAHLTSFGFRGEALASIAAVSRFTLITKDAASREGICITFKDQMQHEELVAAPVGTDITIDDLFYNVPARKKFLKKPETEWRQIMILLHAFCLNHCDVHFSVMHNGVSALLCPPASRLHRISHIWDASTAQLMLPFTRTHNAKDIDIQGLISHHQLSKFDRTSLFFFVNKRWVKNQSLAKALIKGYMNVLPPGRYPIAAIFINVNPTTLDINTHPRKEEVLFLHAQTIEQLLQTAIRKTLEEHLSAQLQRSVTVEPTFSGHTYYNFPQPVEYGLITDTTRAIPPLRDYNSSLESTIDIHQQERSRMFIQPSFMEEQTIVPLLQTQALDPDTSFEIVGYYKNTYILIERIDGLFIVDQHAAHERILYEQFSSHFDTLAPISLLFPISLDFTSDEMHILTQHLEIFTKSGIIIEPFGKNRLVITATPVCLKNQALDDIVRMVATWIMQENAPSREELHALIAKKLYAMMACKAAVKAGDVLTKEHMQQLLQDLQTTNNRFTCPHGRPTSWLLHLHEIEKKFKRRS